MSSNTIWSLVLLSMLSTHFLCGQRAFRLRTHDIFNTRNVQTYYLFSSLPRLRNRYHIFSSYQHLISATTI